MPDVRTRRLITAFNRAYGQAPVRGVRAPGRVNLIGEHTDYNDGFCLPIAIERDVRIVLRPRRDRLVRVLSLEQAGVPLTFELQRTIPKAIWPVERWGDYVKGCAQMLLSARVPLVGVDLAVTGDVPLGSGLSSSAALEVATIHALLLAARQRLSGAQIATLAQRAENRYVGVNCGILDQLSSACAQQSKAMLMDCRSLKLSYATLPPGVAVVIADTGRRRGLVNSAYNERRAQCEAGAQALGVSHLRDATLPALWSASTAGRLDALARQRCEHVVAENGRTVAAFAALRVGDAVALGHLMDQSHADLRDRFAVTCPELDVLVAIARSLPGCLGSRMTGAGFGGCTVSLVQERAVKHFVTSLGSAYRARYPLPFAAYVTRAAPGAGSLTLR